MAQTNPNQQPQHQDPDAQFSLTPAIFTPFPGVSPTPPVPLDQTEKLQKLLSNLATQHENVRQNMLFLVTQRAEKLISLARAELSSLGEDVTDLEIEIPGERERVREAIEEMIRKMKVKAIGKKSEEFEVKAEGVVARGNNGSPPQFFPRTAPVIRKEIAYNLKELINRAVVEIEAYDEHAKSTANHYKQALERRMPRSVGVGTAGVVPPGGVPGIGGYRSDGVGGGYSGGGILTNRHVQSPVDPQALRRMSTGMPIVLAPMQGQPPTRSFENTDELARRGSK